jgi:uncharacterized iron-regulated membrane protein
MKSLWFSTNRWLTWFHRWAGVVLCLLFAVWFTSGAVLHFVGFPSLSSPERHAASAVLDIKQIVVSPGQAMSRIPDARDLRLVNRAGQPAYLVQSGNTSSWVAVSGRSRESLPDISPAEAQSIAENFGHAKAAPPVGPVAYDQWIVHQHFDPFRPFYRVRLHDARQTDLYVSARTGEVLQRTRFAERAWNWVGAIIHWIYFTPLRHSWSAWNQVVWWISLAALLSSAAGAWLGVVRMMANRAAGRGGLSPFRGWMRWHHLIGLFASVIVIAWMLSGWLSMDHGRVFSMGHATDNEIGRLSGVSIADAAQAATVESLQKMGPATEIAFNAVDGHAFLTSYKPGSGEARISFLDGAALLPSIPESILLAGIRNVWPSAYAATFSSSYDSLYRRAESAGDDTVGFIAGDGAPLRVYVDRYSGRFVAVMDLSRRSYAWIYYGLHTLEFPGLIEHPALRTALVLSLLALGFASSATGVVLSVKRLKREFS